MTITRLTASVLGVVALLLAACGAPPTEEVAEPAATDQPAATAAAEPSATEAATESATEDLYAQLEGLDPEQRRETLLEMAAEEEGAVMFYGSPNVDDITPVLEGFTEETGIETELFRSGAREVFQRVLQEAEAGRLGADAIIVSQGDMAALEAEGLLMPLQTPLMDELVPDGRSETFAPAYLAVHVAAWNTDRVGPEQQPSTWEDVLVSPPGLVAFDQSDYGWFATLVTEYFMAEQGMTEEEAVKVFQDAMPDNVVMRGHSAGTELLLAGEFAMHASLYMHDVRGFQDAPIEWEPAVEPVIYMPFSVGVTATSARPASALLLVDYILGAEEGQAIFASVGRTPANLKVEEGAIPPEYESMGVPSEILLEERDKWEQLWLDEVVSRVGDDRT